MKTHIKCRNKYCHKVNKVHSPNDLCGGRITSVCSKCSKDIMEKDRTYSLQMFGSVFCYACSPLGILPKGQDEQEKKRNAFIATRVYKGDSMDEAINKCPF